MDASQTFNVNFLNLSEYFVLPNFCGSVQLIKKLLAETSG